MRPIRLVLAASLALLAACGEGPREQLEGRLQGLVGASETDLVRRMGGEPTRVVEQGSTRYVSWTILWPTYPNGPVVPEEAEQAGRFCETTFAVEQGRVAGYGLRGEGCGQGGFPRVAPA
jgi:hypothetical protein